MDYFGMKPFKNGFCKTASGQKQLAFDPIFLELRPVLYRVYSGSILKRGTVQGASNGDIILSKEWNGDDSEIRVYLFGVDNLSFEESKNYLYLLREKHIWIDNWLKTEKGEVRIPDEVIASDMYLSNVVKSARIKNFLDRFQLPYNFHCFLTSKKEDLKLKPRKLDIDLDEYESVFSHWTLEDCEIDVQEAFFGSQGTGNVATGLEFKPRYIEQHPDFQSDSPGVPGIRGWDKWKYIIRIKQGVSITGKVSHGMSIDIWINNNTKSLINLKQKQI